MNNEKHEQRIKEAEKAITAGSFLAQQGKYRQAYHFMAPAGWINDPNGLIYFQKKYHLFYQYNPYQAVWGSMHWGHAVSDDLLHWDHWPIALAPSESYDDHPEGGCFSGSAVEDNGELNLLYTAAVNTEYGSVQTQCLAVSTDGAKSFQKYDHNPVISALPAGISEDFRDPKVIRYQNFWYLVLGASSGSGARGGGDGCALLYQSSDLKKWEYRGVIARSDGKLGSMWECPDLFPLRDKWILLFSPMLCGEKKTIYLIGSMNFETACFLPEQQGELDFGPDYYAPASFLDPKGRRVLMAWANGWEWMPWHTGFGKTENEGWRGHLAIPRELRRLESGQLQFIPIQELETLRTKPKKYTAFTLPAGEVFEIQAGNGIQCELIFEISLKNTSAEYIHFNLRCGAAERVRITVNLLGKDLIWQKKESSGEITTICRPLYAEQNENFKMHIFMDTCSVEVLADNYRLAASGNVYFSADSNRIYIEAEGGEASFNNIYTYGLKSCQQN
ncbi:sucrose-6-phosphate hydrolase [Lachnospiraceae bacterium oral taxon 500]|nr:sucrose-6-phosphate hydrolase [Lachnospiraceae bacterium oral taxon 500]